MEEVITVGLDIAKSVFQVHGVDAESQVVVQRRLTRAKLVAFFEKLPPIQLMARRTTKIAAVALANKTARMTWAIMTSGEVYREPAPSAA